MSAGAAKCISYAPSIEGQAHGDWRVSPSPAIHAESGAWWVRIWISWDHLAPDPNKFRWSYWDWVCGQIEAAKQAGYAVTLVAHRFPRWINSDVNFESPDAIADRQTPDGNLKDPEFRIPNDCSTSSAWAQWIYFLASTLSYYNGSRPPFRWIDALEFCNEPNGQMWPILDSAGSLWIHCKVAQMFQTAQTATNALGQQPFLLGPATADTRNLDAWTRAFVNPNEFTRQLREQLISIGYQPAPNVIWSHHNYQDIVDLRWSSPSSNAIQQVRAQLTGWWRGWPNSPSFPYLFLTEGGVTKKHLESRYGPMSEESFEAWQNYYLGQALPVLRSNHPCGVGISLVTQYLTYTDPTFDSGLLRAYPSNFSRPARETWRVG